MRLNNFRVSICLKNCRDIFQMECNLVKFQSNKIILINSITHTEKYIPIEKIVSVTIYEV